MPPLPSKTVVHSGSYCVPECLVFPKLLENKTKGWKRMGIKCNIDAKLWENFETTMASTFESCTFFDAGQTPSTCS